MYDALPILPVPEEWSIRPFTVADRAALLRLNADNQPAVSLLDEAELTRLLESGGYHLVAVSNEDVVVGYLLSFARESRYDDTEIAEFRRRLSEPFIYVCQVAIAPEYRRRRIGRAFYRAVMDHARRQGVRTICSDVNLDPPNLESFAFHRELGFHGIGLGKSSDGTAITFLVRQL